MKYLYGDATPFPFEENFIDTLVAATDCCVALLRLDQAAESSRRAAEQARIDANAEISDLEDLGKAVKTALSGRLGATNRAKKASEVAAERLAIALDNTVKQNRTAVLRKRDQAVASVGLDRTGGAVLQTLGKFLREHQLPDTEWRLRWKAGAGPAEAHVSLGAACGLQAVLEVAIPREHPWAGALPVGQLIHGLGLDLPSDKSWIRGGTRVRRESLDKLVITQVEVSKDRKVVVLSRGKKELVNAFEIVVSSKDQSRPSLKRLDAGNEEPLFLEGVNADAVGRLWTRIEATVGELSHYRSNIVLASLDKQSVRDVHRPREVAQAILDSVGPIVREMRRRSRMPGEITLKRELGNGRREELFIPKQKLQTKFTELAPGYRDMFEAYGLDATSEIVTTERAPHAHAGIIDDLPDLVAPPPAPDKKPLSLAEAAAKGGRIMPPPPGATQEKSKTEVLLDSDLEEADEDAETNVPVEPPLRVVAK